ncbi:MAG: hypothetical protein V4584_07305 [Verrucomicrobiota bacterium]
MQSQIIPNVSAAALCTATAIVILCLDRSQRPIASICVFFAGVTAWLIVGGIQAGGAAGNSMLVVGTFGPTSLFMISAWLFMTESSGSAPNCKASFVAIFGLLMGLVNVFLAIKLIGSI